MCTDTETGGYDATGKWIRNLLATVASTAPLKPTIIYVFYGIGIDVGQCRRSYLGLVSLRITQQMYYYQIYQ